MAPSERLFSARPDVTGSKTGLPASVTSKLLAGLEQSAIESILATAQVREIAAKCTILSEGEPASHLFLLRAGQARYYKLTKAGNEILLQLLLPGDVFGLGTLLEHPPNYIGSGEALSDCELLAWEHTSVRKLAKTYPQLAENGLRIVLHYLKNYSDRHVGLVAKSAQQRLAARGRTTKNARAETWCRQQTSQASASADKGSDRCSA